MKAMLCIFLGISTQLAIFAYANDLKQEFDSINSPKKMHEFRLKIIASEDLSLYLDFFELDPTSFTKAVLSGAPEHMKLEYVRGILLKEKGWGGTVYALELPPYGYISPPIIAYLTDLYPKEEFVYSEFETPKRRAVLWKRVSELAGIKVEKLPEAYFIEESKFESAGTTDRPRMAKGSSSNIAEPAGTGKVSGMDGGDLPKEVVKSSRAWVIRATVISLVAILVLFAFLRLRRK